MNRIYSITLLTLILSTKLFSQDTSKSKWTSFINPKIGFTYQNNSKAGSEEANLQWLANLIAKTSFDDSKGKWQGHYF